MLTTIVRHEDKNSIASQTAADRAGKASKFIQKNCEKRMSSYDVERTNGSDAQMALAMARHASKGSTGKRSPTKKNKNKTSASKVYNFVSSEIEAVAPQQRHTLFQNIVTQSPSLMEVAEPPASYHEATKQGEEDMLAALKS